MHTEDDLRKIFLKISEKNHFIKRTIIREWLEDKNLYCFDIEKKIIETKGKNYLDKIFTSILINQEAENTINVKGIEENFENLFLQKKLLLPNEIYYKDKNKKYDYSTNIILSHYIALQLSRSPLYLYYKYECTLEEGKFDNNLETAIYFMADMNTMEDCGFKKLYNYYLNRTKTRSYYLFDSESRILNCSEINTVKLSNFFENEANINYFEENISKKASLDMLNRIYMTVISPKLLLIVNCEQNVCLFDKIIKVIEKDIVSLWNNFTSYAAIEKIILAKNKTPPLFNSGLLKSFPENKIFYNDIKNLINSKGEKYIPLIELVEDARVLMNKQKNNRKTKK